jgi:beta-N-acetylhexosaminidase
MLSAGYSVAELVIMGFSGKTLSAETLAMLKREKPALFILFTAPNFESKEQLIALTEELQSRISENGDLLPAIISADQEGGRVQRFRNGFTLLPPALKVGNKKDIALALELAKLQARELFAAGINLNFAPTCDINTNPENPVIGDRAYGDTEKQVSEMIEANVKGHLSEQVHPCLKHFPGHGDTHLDSHESLPFVTTPLELLRTREWIPFKTGLKAGCKFVMSAHIMLPHLDPLFPGTLSSTFLKTYLRGELGFQGAIISDDMEMGAITKNYGKEEAPILALSAGCDLLIYRHEEEALIAIESIKKALKEGRISAQILEASIDRVRAIRKLMAQPRSSGTVESRVNLIGRPESLKFIEQNFR